MSSAAQPSFQFSRIERNRQAYVLAVILLVAAVAPLVMVTGYGAAMVVVRLAGSHTSYLVGQVRSEERYLRRLRTPPAGEELDWLAPKTSAYSSEWMREIVTQRAAALARSRAELARSQASDRGLLGRLLPATIGGLAAILALLYWGTCSSPTTRLVANIGALPAGAGEADAIRLVEDLCSRVGLRPPKLYIIQSEVPYTLSAAMDSHTAMLAVTRGALNLLDQRELEAMLAHEISHIGNQDIRLNALMASATLFITLPLTELRRRWMGRPDDSSEGYTKPYDSLDRGEGFYFFVLYRIVRLVLSPMSIYVFVVAPIAGHLIRAFMSHDLEYMADADAAGLTGNPEGLVSALAKIGGATANTCDSNPAFQHSCVAGASAMGGWLGRSFKPTHPSPGQRIQKLVDLFGAARFTGLKAAIDTGKQYIKGHEAIGEDRLTHVAQNDMAAIRQGNAMGRVCRLIATEDVPVYDSQRPDSLASVWLKPGDLLVVFDDLGNMRPINTCREHFGYIERKVKLKAVPSMLPQEVYDPTARAAAEEALARREAAAPALAAASPTGALGLTKEQLWIVVGFSVAVFAGITILLVVSLGK